MDIYGHLMEATNHEAANKIGATIFGNAVDDKRISAPMPEFVAKWAKLNEDVSLSDFDYLEPNYLKNFKI